MRVIRFATKDGSQESIGISLDDEVLNFTEAFQAYRLLEEGTCACPIHSPVALMEAGLFSVDTFANVLDFAKKHGMTDRFTANDHRILAPIKRPSKVLALGRNSVSYTHLTLPTILLV